MKSQTQTRLSLSPSFQELLLSPKLSVASLSQIQQTSVYVKSDAKSILKNIIQPMMTQEKFFSESQDQLMTSNPLQHPILQSNKSQQYLESFKSYLQGSFDPQEMIFSKNFPKLLSRIQDQEIKEKYIQHSVKRNRFLQKTLTSLGQPEITMKKVYFEREENKFEKHFLLKGTDETKQKLRVIDQKWQIKEASNKKNAQQKTANRWELLRQVINDNIKLRQKLNKKKKGYHQINQKQSKIMKLLQNTEQSQLQPQELRNSKLKDFTVLAQPPLNAEQMLQIAKLKHTSTTARHRHVLMSLYFRTNADSFIHVSRDPFPVQYRKLLIQSDSEYNKVLHTYLNKVQLYKKWNIEQEERHNLHKKDKILQDKQKLKTNTTNHSQNNSTTYKPMERASNPMILSNSIQGQERLYMDRLADLECFDASHMQKTLINDKFIDKGRKFCKQKMKTVQGIQNKSINNNSSQFYTTIKHNKMIRHQDKDKMNYSDDDSDASITETALDQLYMETNLLNKKLVQKVPKEQRTLQVMRRIKTLLKLDEVQRKIIQANLIRLKV